MLTFGARSRTGNPNVDSVFSSSWSLMVSMDLLNRECLICFFLGDGESFHRSTLGGGFGVEFSAILSKKILADSVWDTTVFADFLKRALTFLESTMSISTRPSWVDVV